MIDLAVEGRYHCHSNHCSICLSVRLSHLLALTKPTQHVLAILLRERRSDAVERVVEDFPRCVRCLLCIILYLFLDMPETLWLAQHRIRRASVLGLIAEVVATRSLLSIGFTRTVPAAHTRSVAPSMSPLQYGSNSGSYRPPR